MIETKKNAKNIEKEVVKNKQQ